MGNHRRQVELIKRREQWGTTGDRLSSSKDENNGKPALDTRNLAKLL
jgi:hypothetical protein